MEESPDTQGFHTLRLLPGGTIETMGHNTSEIPREGTEGLCEKRHVRSRTMTHTQADRPTLSYTH